MIVGREAGLDVNYASGSSAGPGSRRRAFEDRSAAMGPGLVKSPVATYILDLRTCKHVLPSV